MSAAVAVPGDRVRVTMHVRVPPSVAFEVYTKDIDQWWQRGPRFRFGRYKAGGGVLGFVDGHLIERFDDGSSWTIGKVLAWDEGARLAFEWRLTNFAPDERTEVEVRFAATGNGEGTEVTLEHRGWAAIRPDHPARHGEDARVFIRRNAMWWHDALAGFRRAMFDREPPT